MATLRFVLVMWVLFVLLHIFLLCRVCVWGCGVCVCVVCVCGLVPQAMDGARRHCRGTGRRRRPPIPAGAGLGTAPSHARTAACLEHAGVRIDRARDQDVDLLCDRVRQAGAVVLDACVSINRVKTNRGNQQSQNNLGAATLTDQSTDLSPGARTRTRRWNTMHRKASVSQAAVACRAWVAGRFARAHAL
jgi:hypothetical protein